MKKGKMSVLVLVLIFCFFFCTRNKDSGFVLGRELCLIGKQRSRRHEETRRSPSDIYPIQLIFPNVIN